VGFVLRAFAARIMGRAFVIRKSVHLKIFKTVTSGSLAEDLRSKWVKTPMTQAGK
jgi:hypothetical protein